MDESRINELLAAFPGAKRAAQGLILPGKDGAIFHLLNVIPTKELEGLSQEEAFFYDFCSRKEILRLRELGSAHDYLLRIRANAIADSPRAIRVIIARRKTFESTGRKWTLSHYYHSKDFHHKSYISLLQRANAKKLKSIPSGLAFITEANAVCVRSLVGDVVIASESLEYFYYFMTLAFYGQQLGIEFIDRADALLIAVRIMNGAEALDFDIDPRGTLPPDTERTLAALVKAQMQFTFGHEYAHLLCGHLSESNTPGGAVSVAEGMEHRKNLRLYSHELEFQADLYAVKHVHQSESAFAAIAQGAFSVLLYLHFLQEMREPCGLRALSVSDTHPAALERIHRLHKGLGKKSPLDEETMADILAVSTEMSSVLAHRLKDAREDLLTFYGSIYLPSYVTRPKQDRYDF